MKKDSHVWGLWFALAVMLFSAAQTASAAESHKYLADSNYKSAQDYHGAGQCIEAMDAANRALSYYGMDGDSEGVQKTIDLIGKIKECLKKAGDAFFQQADAAYTAKKMEDAISWAQSAKQQYDAIPDNFSSQKCTDIIIRANYSIQIDREGRANRTYQDAVRYYESEDLPNAKVKANEALELFMQINKADGVKLSEALISAIDKKIIELIEFGNQKIARGTDLYRQAEGKDFKKLLEAKKNAEEAKGLYQKAGYAVGYNTSSELIKACWEAISKLEQMVNALAEQKVIDGRNLYLLGQGAKNVDEELAYYNVSNATYWEARDYYWELYSWAKERYDTAKTKYYQDKLYDVDNKIGVVNKAINDIVVFYQAEELFKDANTFFTRGFCRNASASAQDAKSKFKSINAQADAFKCDTLLYQIEDCIEKTLAAESHLRNATEYIKVADYVNATNETDKAMSLYTEIKYEEGIKNATEYKKNISVGQERKNEADKIMAKAHLDYEQNRFDECKKSAEGARAIYKQINYLHGINESERLSSDAQKEIDAAGKNARESMMILAGAIVVGLIVVVVAGYSKRVKRQKMREEEMMRKDLASQQEAEKKRVAEKMAEEQRAREMDAERQRLKAMIADEMKKVEQDKRNSGQI